MGKFTEYDAPWVDGQIELQLRNIVELIKENIPKVRSILLAGGFGRGEGSVEIVGDNVLPLKDYDIYVIVDKIPSKKCRDLLNKKIHSKLMLSENRGPFKFSSFTVDISVYTKFLLKIYLDITLWELKHASLLLYGEDVRSIISWGIKDIPLSNGLRFLFEKTTGLTALFSKNYILNRNINEKKSKSLIYECYKTYVEIASVLCLAMGCYEPSYRKRLVLFKEKMKQELPNLSEKVSKLEEYVVKGTEFKLKPNFINIKESISELWLQTRETLCEVLRYYFEKTLNVRVNSWTESYEELSRAMAYQYYTPVVRAALAKIGFHSEFLTKIANMAFLVYQKLTTVFRLARNEKTLYLRPLFQPQSPLMTLYVTSILVLLSLKRNGEIDAHYSQKALRNLRNVLPCKIGQKISWDDLRDLYIKAIEMHRGGAK